MRLSRPFDPIEPGETDLFVFDFTGDCGEAEIVSAVWTCTLGPNQAAGFDPAPQSRILETMVEGILQVPDPLTGVPVTRNGKYAVALVGGMPPSALGATYVLEAVATLNDGRVIAYNATLPCSSTAVGLS